MGSEAAGKALRDHHVLTTTPAHCPQTALTEIHLWLCIKYTCGLHEVSGNNRMRQRCLYTRLDAWGTAQISPLHLLIPA